MKATYSRPLATRKLWTRRMIRAGWLLAPILEIPFKLTRLLFGSWKRVRNTVSTFVVGSLVTTCTVASYVDSLTATPEQITLFATGNEDPRLNWCIANDLPKQIKHFNRVLTLGDLKDVKNSCIKVNAITLTKTEQMRIIESLKPKTARELIR